MRRPEFWRTENGIARLLTPFGAVVAAMTARRVSRDPDYRAPVPVISVGNLSVGGTGKTPVAADIAARLRAAGKRPAVLLRGYGGSLRGPVKVDELVHSARDVGDEALLHAANGPTWVARERAAAAKEAVADGADVLVLDDGHQHSTLAKDVSLVLVDGRYGFGNGRVIPAGPLREPIVEGLQRASAIVVMGEDPTHLSARLAVGRIPVLSARLVPGPERLALKGQRVVAFAGIGEPLKFFRTLEAIGAQIVAVHPFDDHHQFGSADIQPILDEAFSLRAIPVTTAKDAARLSPDQRQQVNVLSVGVAWDDETALSRLLAVK